MAGCPPRLVIFAFSAGSRSAVWAKCTEAIQTAGPAGGRGETHQDHFSPEMGSGFYRRADSWRLCTITHRTHRQQDRLQALRNAHIHSGRCTTSSNTSDGAKSAAAEAPSLAGSPSAGPPELDRAGQARTGAKHGRTAARRRSAKRRFSRDLAVRWRVCSSRSPAEA